MYQCFYSCDVSSHSRIGHIFCSFFFCLLLLFLLLLLSTLIFSTPSTFTLYLFISTTHYTDRHDLSKHTYLVRPMFNHVLLRSLPAVGEDYLSLYLLKSPPSELTAVFNVIFMKLCFIYLSILRTGSDFPVFLMVFCQGIPPFTPILKYRTNQNIDCDRFVLSVFFFF